MIPRPFAIPDFVHEPGLACAPELARIFDTPRVGDTDSATVRDAKGLCRRCPLRDRCLNWALTHGEDEGIWGATTPKDRRRILRDHAREAFR